MIGLELFVAASLWRELSTDALREAFPGVYIDARGRAVEFDATVSGLLVPDERSPRFYLEVVACAPDTREHEAFVALAPSVKASNIHAALLAIGLTPGAPGRVVGPDGQRHNPTGDAVDVRIVQRTSGRRRVGDPLEWTVNARSGERLAEVARRTRAKFLFAGSRVLTREGRNVYDADGTGVIVGLTTFGSEVIAFSTVISPDAGVDEPVWIADFSRTPAARASVRVRITPKY